VLLLQIGSVAAASRDGQWVFTHAANLDQRDIYEYEVAKGVRKIGCVEADYTGGLAVGDGEALLAIRHDETGSTVLRFPF
jgi:hypothetical protein